MVIRIDCGSIAYIAYRRNDLFSIFSLSHSHPVVTMGIALPPYPIKLGYLDRVFSALSRKTGMKIRGYLFEDELEWSHS